MKIILLFLITILLSCSSSQADKNYPSTGYHSPAISVDSIPVLTADQQSAFDALNTLQTSTDKKYRLYSTFANLDQPFYPADTSFVISQAELMIFMEEFVSKYCQHLEDNLRDELIKKSVLAQEEYTVLYCNSQFLEEDFKEGLPMSGTWVIPNVLGRRDVIISW